MGKGTRTPHLTLLFQTLARPPTPPGLMAYPNPSGNFQAPYTSIAYTGPIPLLGSSLGFLPNHAYQTLPCFNAYGQSEASSFGYATTTTIPF
jgi:hypothetical protein